MIQLDTFKGLYREFSIKDFKKKLYSVKPVLVNENNLLKYLSKIYFENQKLGTF